MSRGIVLVADDCALTRTIFKRLLYAREFLAICHEDGEAAFECLEKLKETPVAIITDVNMPVLDGPGLALKLSSSKFKHIPLIFCTASPFDAPAVLSKPIKVIELDAMLERFKL